MVEIEKTFLDYLKKLSPGTPLRDVVNDLQGARLGALIVFDSPELSKIIIGGFRVNCRFSSQKLFELCKMDGAIIVSADLKRILWANVLLVPDYTIPTSETGTRHMAAERTAKQAKTFVIAVSERKQSTSLYYSYSKYHLKTSSDLLRDVGSNLQILEKQREIFDELLGKLNILEMSDLVSVSDVVKILQRAEIILSLSERIKRDLSELGKEGNVMNMRYKELLKDVEKTEERVIRDYATQRLKKTKVLLSNFSFEGLLDLSAISRLLFEKGLDDPTQPRGYRFLSKLNLTEKEISQIVLKFKNLNSLLEGKQEKLEELLKNKASKIKEETENLREQILSGKVIC